MARTRLPPRRESLTLKVPHPTPGSVIYYDVSVGFHEAEPKELFISCNKLTTAMHISGLEIATLVSIALQHGATLRELADAMPRDDVNQPQGAAGAILEAVIQTLNPTEPPCPPSMTTTAVSSSSFSTSETPAPAKLAL